MVLPTDSSDNCEYRWLETHPLKRDEAELKINTWFARLRGNHAVLACLLRFTCRRRLSAAKAGWPAPSWRDGLVGHQANELLVST